MMANEPWPPYRSRSRLLRPRGGVLPIDVPSRFFRLIL
jgi:hypothetical protein